jgi:hypothetical protein
MLRKTMIVLATAAALTGGLTADAFALATARSSWDGLGAVAGHGGRSGGGAYMGGGFDGAISAVLTERVATSTTTEVSVAARVSGPADRDAG